MNGIMCSCLGTSKPKEPVQKMSAFYNVQRGRAKVYHKAVMATRATGFPVPQDQSRSCRVVVLGGERFFKP